MTDDITTTENTAASDKRKTKLIWLLQYAVKSLIFGDLIYSIHFVDISNVSIVNAIWLGALILMMISPILYFGVVLLMLIIAAEFPRKFRIERNFFTKHILNVLIIAAGAALFTGAFVVIGKASRAAAQKAFDQGIDYYVHNSETIIAVEPNSYYEPDGVAGTGIAHPSLFVDYDTHSVAFLLDDHDFKEYHLKENGGTPPGEVQCEIPIDPPGKLLVSYYPGEENLAHRTTGLKLVMEDGTEYSCPVTSEAFDNDYLSLDARLDGSWYAKNKISTNR